MKAFDELTEQFQKRRLRRVAEAAIAEYPFEVTKLRFHAWHTNSTWRVDTADGAIYALRVGSGEHDSATHTASELEWLTHAGASGLPTVEPVPNRAGSLLTPIEIEGVPGRRTCVAFRWLPGRPFSEKLTAAGYTELGRLAARLHTAAETFAPGPSFSPLTWDRVFYYPAEPVVWHEDRFSELITEHRRRVIEEVIERASAELSRLHASSPVVIHGDLHPDNVMVYRKAMTLFDFEDAMWGQPVQDIAITLFYERDHADYASFRTAFEDGYREERVWPVAFDGQLELLMAARTVMFINYVLRIDDDPLNYVETATNRLRLYLSS